jgi:hypothetical protein
LTSELLPYGQKIQTAGKTGSYALSFPNGPPPICKWILEVAPLHSIASSARPDRGNGTVMPSGAQFQPLSRFSPGSEVAEGVSGGWSRLYRLRLVSCGPLWAG